MNLGAKSPGAKAPQAKPKNLWGTVRRLLGYMKKSTALVVIAVIAAVAGTFMTVAGPKLLGGATNMVFSGVTGTGIDFTALGRQMMIIGFLYAGIFLATFLQERLMTVVSQKTGQLMRDKLKEKMARVPVSFFDSRPGGELMSVAANDMDNIVQCLQMSLTQLITSAITVVGVLVVMLTISPFLTLLSLLMIPGTLVVMAIFSKRTSKASKAYFSQLGELNGCIEETCQGFEVIKSFSGEEDTREKLDKINGKLYESGWKSKFYGGSMMPSMLLVQNSVYVVVAIAGAIRVVGGVITIGDMQAFLQYSGQFSNPLMKVTQVWGNVLSAAASAERVFELLDAEEMEMYEDTYEEKEETAKVVFDHVKFSYTSDPLMKDFSLAVPAGDTIAVVGHTGAGKTTLISLLQRFYEITGGSIRIDGRDIRSMSREEVRDKTAMVLQETWLFSGTILDNIRYGNPNASEREVHAAAKAAFADDFIRSLPNGYYTVLKEDAENISQGQRQLLTIARAFAANPEILILDEATSSVDSRTEMVIQKAMKKLMAGRTSFVVAHRLSTIYGADQIVVMDQGDIVETGTHKELLYQDGVYADIYYSQFAGGRESRRRAG